MSDILFDALPLSPEVARAVQDMNFTTATGIQAQAIPLLLDGTDLIGRSSTGTGKTAAFGVPAIERIDPQAPGVQVLVLSPTRELAMQIAQEMRKFAKYKTGVSVAPVYGGAPMDAQIRQLRGANVVIGTPGRILDHLRRKTLRLEHLRMAVLDEADEMLNMGFYEDIQTILSQTPEERQTVLFSATMPPAILKLTEAFLRNPQTVDIRTAQRTISTVEQFYYQVPQYQKMDAINLLLQLHEPRRSIVFCNTKAMVDELSSYLCENGFKAQGIHGDMKQTGRTQVMQAFRDGRARILVATDVAARGIDVENIEAVYNFDIPQEFEYYIHRIGRTGRAGKAGTSHTLVCNPRQLSTLNELARFTKAPIARGYMPSAEDLRLKRSARMSARVLRAIDASEYTHWEELIDSICTEHEIDARTIACALMQAFSSKEKKGPTVPNLEFPNRGGRFPDQSRQGSPAVRKDFKRGDRFGDRKPPFGKKPYGKKPFEKKPFDRDKRPKEDAARPYKAKGSTD